ncbi:MAG: nucleoside deaminase [Candidatus Obscuribacterales bacterium]|nr:nucleoside deaminase [Candidatus Obscuribacterales bacterium]
MSEAPTSEQILRNLRRANVIATRARQFGHQPFGCVVVAPDHETVLIEHGNIGAVDHAESCAARLAWRTFNEEYLWTCTMYTTVEPCAMCAGAIYWSNIGKLVYGISESSLRDMTGDDPANPTLSLPCRQLFATGQKSIEVIGPFAELADEIEQLHRNFWKPASKA